MLKVHVADRLAIAAGLVAPARPTHRVVSLAVVATVLTAVVGLMSLYVGVREMTQPGSLSDHGEYASVQDLQRVTPAAGPDKLMSIEDIKAIAGQD